MIESVPPLVPKPPGIGLRTLGLALPGIRRVSAQIEPYTRWWSDGNQQAVVGEGPLLTVIGDSTAIGIGASAPDRGYVGLLRDALGERDGRPWRVVNLAQSGAKTTDGLERQLPIVNDLPPADLTVCCIGTNDVVWSTDTTGPRERLRTLIAGLPEPALIAIVAGGSPRTRLVNRAIRSAGSERGLEVIDPWREPGPGPRERLADDRFHPNDLGYLLMARPFARALDAPEPTGDEQPDTELGESDTVEQ